MPRVGERPVDEQVAALERAPGDETPVGRRESRVPEAGPEPRRLLAPGERLAVEPRAAGALRGAVLGEEVGRVA